LVTDLIHGPEATVEAQRASEILFGGELGGVGESTFREIVGEVPTREIESAKLAVPGASVLDLFVHSGLVPSKGQARKDLEGGGLYLNNVRLTEVGRLVGMPDLLFGRYLLLRKGRRNYTVLTVS